MEVYYPELILRPYCPDIYTMPVPLAGIIRFTIVCTTFKGNWFSFDNIDY